MSRTRRIRDWHDVSDDVLYDSLLGLAKLQEVWGHLSEMATIQPELEFSPGSGLDE
jgi:hypothetical protein